MPTRVKRYCIVPGCNEYAVKGSNYCNGHRKVQRKDYRPAAHKRGYGRAWQSIRKRVLAESGIPQEQWPLYDVDHNPAYNPAVEPDHWKYDLIPRLHADHSRKTVREDGGFGNKNG